MEKIVQIKREDLAGMELGGNKFRKLEFLMAEAVAQVADCIITTGYIQSSLCCAVSVAAKYLNLDSYFILITSKVDQDPGLIGNLLVKRMTGAHIQLVSMEEFLEFGDETLANILKEKLIKEGRRPYVIPGGGSNSLGTWGYIEAIREIEQQIHSGPNNMKFDDIVVACSSGGTAAGLCLGSSLSSLKARVHAFTVFRDPDYFYDFIQSLLDGLQAGVNSRDIVEIHNAVGLGYGINTSEELNLLKEIAVTTGVILHPSYSGKAVHRMLRDMSENPKKWEGRKVLFIHTGGLLGWFEKLHELASLVGNWQRMDVPGSAPGRDNI